MSGKRIETEAKKVGETISVPFDFTSDLAVGETVDSASVSVSVFSGVDASPEAINPTGPENDSPIVYQKFTGGILGTIYLAVCTAATSEGNDLQISTYIAIESP